MSWLDQLVDQLVDQPVQLWELISADCGHNTKGSSSAFPSCISEIHHLGWDWIMIIIALKGAIGHFYHLLTAPRTVSNTYAQVARAQSCADHFYHMQPAVCHLIWRDSSAIKFDKVQIIFILSSSYWLEPLTDFCVCARFFNPTIEVVTFCLHRWLMLAVFVLPAFTCLGHDCHDLLNPCDGMHVCTD